MGSSSLVKEIRESVAAIGRLPAGLVSAVMEPAERFRERRERIAKLKELAEIRELIKILDRILIVKGDAVRSIQAQIRRRDAQAISDLRSEIMIISESLHEARNWLLETSLSGAEVAGRGAYLLGQSSGLFEELGRMSDEELFTDDTLESILLDVVSMQSAAFDVLKNIDDHRRSLDHTYG